ncbi:probable metallophosphoesterase domain-containing protein 2 [Rhynchosporium agropyri]|uniref:Probable metallophosphoesterase domain-containing protein 2 n=1 Tax=Rhynchosporium agropyri TaxID=914238 RepID=A0A1E1KAZ3_9HELO|nr:probable metallophosphoesterase domain-containing protein 2 [Rhynchosporium agropyri]
MAPTVPTRIMVISDTHEHSFDGNSLPDADVLIHTGDLTNFGELSSLRECVRMIGTIDAKIKLIIAGNHDISLDKIRRVDNMTDDEYSKYHEEAIEIMTGAAAKEAGIVYLEEGTHTFTLDNGAEFQVYASPYTPGSGGWTFPYQSHEDRFNNSEQVATNRTSIATNPIPAGVHIVMTHGPPHSILDQADGRNLGCLNLLRALGRVRPLMHCFGHIHEGHGANIVTWKSDGSVKNPSSATPLETEQVNEFPYTNEWPIKAGQQTLMVNAAIMMNTAKGMKPNHKPFIVQLDLPRK